MNTFLDFYNKLPEITFITATEYTAVLKNKAQKIIDGLSLDISLPDNRTEILEIINKLEGLEKS